MKLLLFAFAGLAGLGASTALATGGHHPPPSTTCDKQCPPPQTVTVTTVKTTPPVTVTSPPVTSTVTQTTAAVVTQPAPPAITLTQTTPAPPAVTTTVERKVERPYPPCARGYKRGSKGNCVRTVERVVVQRVFRTKVIHDRCPPPPKCCVGKG